MSYMNTVLLDGNTTTADGASDADTDKLYSARAGINHNHGHNGMAANTHSRNHTGMTGSEPPNGHSAVPMADFQLEMHNVSYIRSFTTGRWYNKIFNPPITAQFLKDVTLELRAGEVMGVIGSSGSGKTTLLNVVGRRVQGTTAGRILLNSRPLTEKFFQNQCAYVSFKQSLLGQLSVHETLSYQAKLALSPAVTGKQKRHRVEQLMVDFELGEHADRRVEQLSEPARRRLLVALHLIRDPVLLLIDEPTRSVSPLAAYQLLHTVYSYMKRANRMALVTCAQPRSDIYQLFDRITILFFGEVVYSGYTKQMPVYFRQIGYPCPASENPAIYYLSLATVDRETSERYMETQEQAVKLIDMFKAEGSPLNVYQSTGVQATPHSHVLLCQLGRPSTVVIAATLVSRTWRHYLGHNGGPLTLRLLAWPLAAAILGAAYFDLDETSATAPLSRAGLIFNMQLAITLISVFIAAHTGASLRTRYMQDSWDGLYSGVTFISSIGLANLPIDAAAIAAGCAILFWAGNLSGGLIGYMYLTLCAFALWHWAHCLTWATLLCFRASFNAARIAATLLIAAIVVTQGFLKAPSTYMGPTEWLAYAVYISPYYFASRALHGQQVAVLAGGRCASTSDGGVSEVQPLEAGAPVQLCRWQNGIGYLQEMYGRSPGSELDPSPIKSPSADMGVLYVFACSAALLTMVAYALPLPHFVKRKSRFK